MTFADALSASTSTCRSLDDRIKRLKVILDATEQALFDAAAGGAVQEYRVNTGQTDMRVEVTSLSELQKNYRGLTALYNELCQIKGGSNITVLRDASTLGR